MQGDIFVSDFTQATVITMYLLPALNLKLRPQILAMRPGTRVVSHSFNMDDWEPDEISSMDGRRAYFWVVPANVAGTWALEASGDGACEKIELTLEQRFQKIEGTPRPWARCSAGLRDARLRGFSIAFAYVDGASVRRDFTGRVSGGRMEGSFRADNGTEGRWTATKKYAEGGPPGARSAFLVGAVAERLLARCACSRTATPSAPRSTRELHRRERPALVRAVAERLALGLAAGAPPVIAGRQLDGIGRLLRDQRVGHRIASLSVDGARHCSVRPGSA